MGNAVDSNRADQNTVDDLSLMSEHQVEVQPL